MINETTQQQKRTGRKARPEIVPLVELWAQARRPSEAEILRAEHRTQVLLKAQRRELQAMRRWDEAVQTLFTARPKRCSGRQPQRQVVREPAMQTA